MSLISGGINKTNLIEAGENSEIGEIYPAYVNNTDPKFILIDGMYVASLLVINYNKEMEGGFLDSILSLDIDIELSMFYEKQDSYIVIKDLTYQIGNTGADIKTTNENQLDIDVMSGLYSDAKYIRKQIQLNNEEFYYLYTYIAVYAESEKELEQNLQRIEGISLGIGLQTRRATFRQEQAFFSCLPIMQNNMDIKKVTRRNVLTGGLSSTYPFLSNELCDESGIFIGTNQINHSLVMIDRFDSEKYKNANMCIIGTSGSGKSYLTKLMIIRNRFLNMFQYIIDPDREYTNICKELDGTLIKFGSTNSINIMDIRESFEIEESYLQNKLNNLNAFFCMIFQDISPIEIAILEEKLIECYKERGITFDNNSLYQENKSGKIIIKPKFKESNNMPRLEDLYRLLKFDKKTKKMATLLKPFIDGRMKYLNNYTNIDIKNKIVVADINDIPEDDLQIIMFVITEFYWDKVKEKRDEKKIIYIDEVWRLISNNSEVAGFVLKMFKTLRKYSGAATAITQDINDFLVLEDGKYGKGLINNSSIKCIFQLEENNLKLLKDVVELSEEEIFKIQTLKRGECLLCASRNHIVAHVDASKKENGVITG
jgi:type IV secretory pathway VirB4 component